MYLKPLLRSLSIVNRISNSRHILTWFCTVAKLIINGNDYHEININCDHKHWCFVFFAPIVTFTLRKTRSVCMKTKQKNQTEKCKQNWTAREKKSVSALERWRDSNWNSPISVVWECQTNCSVRMEFWKENKTNKTVHRHIKRMRSWNTSNLKKHLATQYQCEFCLFDKNQNKNKTKLFFALFEWYSNNVQYFWARATNTHGFCAF